MTHPYAAVLPPDDLTFEAAIDQAMAAQGRGDLERAIHWYRRALGLSPGSAGVHNNLGAIFLSLGRLDDSLRHYRSALSLKPDYARAHAGAAAVYTEKQRNLRAVGHNRAAVVIDPSMVNLRFNMGFGLQLTGRAAAAAHCYKSSIGHLPDPNRNWSQYLLSLNYIDAVSPEYVFQEHLKFGARFPDARGRRHANRPDPERKLRIGFISVEFREHLGAYFIAPLFEHADRNNFELYCYNGLPRGAFDRRSEWFRRAADGWRDVGGLSDDDLERLIVQDGVDVLVDLAGHSGLNRLAVAARRPAPVQLTWLGYANTTGLSSFDGRLVDAVTDPPGAADALAGEPLLRPSPCFLGVRLDAGAPPVAPAPALRNGYVTFGSFNHLGKMSPTVTDLWGAILRAVPTARLLLKDRSFDDAETCAFMRARFAAAGVAPERIDFLGWSASRADHLTAYDRVDVALDTVPYNGTITTCDALSQGVPLVTLLGDRHAARVGGSLLQAAGLDELVAADRQGYCDIATSLANDIPRIARLRAGMRDRLAASTLCDVAGFTARFEATCRDLWRRWCASAGGRAENDGV